MRRQSPSDPGLPRSIWAEWYVGLLTNHSGGTAPVFHRSSLLCRFGHLGAFVGEFRKDVPPKLTTGATYSPTAEVARGGWEST